MTNKTQKQQGSIEKTAPADPAEGFAPLLGTLRQLIADSRQQVLRAVDVVQVQTCWHIGRHIVEFEQGGAQRAAYGQRLLPQLGLALSTEFGRGFDATNLRHMRGFYLAFPIRDAVRRELETPDRTPACAASWSHQNPARIRPTRPAPTAATSAAHRLPAAHRLARTPQCADRCANWFAPAPHPPPAALAGANRR